MHRASAVPQLDLSIIVPVFNEEDNVVPLWNEITAALAGFRGTAEIVFVDDGSRDQSGARLLTAAGGDARLVLVRLARNYGQSAAMAAGFAEARGRVIVPLDGDRQNDPAEVPRVVAMLSDEVDVVCGWRKDRHDAALRSFVSRVANRLISRVTGVALHDYGCTLKAFKAEFLKPIVLVGEMHRFLPVFARWQGARITEVAVNHRPRVAGVSKYGLDRTFRVVLDLFLVQFLTRYRGRAMRYLSKWIWGQAFVAFFCLAMAAAGALGAKWSGSRWTLAGCVFAVGTVLTLAIALLAELVTRLHFEATGANAFRVGDVVRGEKSPTA